MRVLARGGSDVYCFGYNRVLVLRASDRASCAWLFTGEDRNLNMMVSPRCGCLLSPRKAAKGFAASSDHNWWQITQPATQLLTNI